MNKKGFTLAEILGVIVVLALILILTVPSVINMINSKKSEAEGVSEEIIYKSVDEYIYDNPSLFPKDKAGRYCITIKDLLDDGKLLPTGSKNGHDVFVNTSTGKDYTELSVMVTIYSSGNKEYEIKKGSECSTLASLPMIDFIIDPAGSAWVKKRTVKILYPKMDGYKYYFKQNIKDVNTGNYNAGSFSEISGLSVYNNDYLYKEVTYDKIAKIYAKMKKNTVISGSTNIVNVDSELPTIDDIDVPTDWTNVNKNVKVKVTDKVSGVKAYYISNNNSKPSESDLGWVNIDYSAGTKNIVLSLGEGTYYLWIKDKAGNINSLVKQFKVDKIDNVKPTCIISENPTSTSTNATLTIQGTDNESGLASSPYSFDGTNFTNKNTNVINKNGLHTGYIKDLAGNIGQCDINVSNIDRKPATPTITNPTNGNWTNKDFSLTVNTSSPSEIIGYWYYSYDQTNWVTYDKSGYDSFGKTDFTTSPFSAQRDQNVYIRVCNKEASGALDNVNCSDSASTRIRIDKTKPVLNYSLTKGKGGNYTPGTELIDDSIIRNLWGTDANPSSGIREIQWRSNGSNTWNKENNTTNWKMTSGTNDAYFRVIDNVGNISNEVHLVLKIYKSCSSTKTVYGSWGGCSKSCGGGTRSRTVKVVDAKNNNKVCSSKTESQACNTHKCAPTYTPNTCGYKGNTLQYCNWQRANDTHGLHNSGYRIYCADSNGNLYWDGMFACPYDGPGNVNDSNKFNPNICYTESRLYL